MGYQDRDYFRDERSPYLELIRSTRVCWGIVIAIILVYLATVFTQDSPTPLYEYLRLDPPAMIQEWQWHRLLTATFVTDHAWHLAFSLLVIWIIGHELEQMLGSIEMLAFFLVAALLSNLAVTLVSYYIDPHAPFGPRTISTFGPAGPALAMLAWSAIISPYRIVQYLFVPMPMWIVACLVLVFDLFFFMQHQPLLIKLSVHILSLPFAVCYTYFAWRITRLPRWTGSRRLPAKRKQMAPVLQMPRRKQHTSDDLASAAETETPLPHKPRIDEQLEAKLDAILEKVSSTGLASLTDEERIFLQQASEMLKKRKS